MTLQFIAPLQALVQCACEAHRDKIGDKFSHYPYSILFVGKRMIEDPKGLAAGLDLGYEFSGYPKVQLPPLENHEKIVVLPSQEEMDLVASAAAETFLNSNNFKNKRKAGSKGKGSHRKK